MKAAAYVRVSSRSQNQESQIDTIQRAAHARGDGLARWFVESKSARTLERPELARLRDAIRRGEVRTLYVFRIDRLTRSGIRDTLSLLEEFKIAGCRVISLADGFDLQGPASDVVIAVLAWAAQMERLALGERIAAARARIEAKGGQWGRPPRVTPDVVATIRARARAGQTVREISMALKVPKSTVGAVVSEKGAYASPIAKEFNSLKNGPAEMAPGGE